MANGETMLNSEQSWSACQCDKILFSWAPKSLQMVTTAMKLKDACFLEEKLLST